MRSKDERRPTVNELANQKYVLQKINGWKIYHLGAGMEDIVDMESELSKRLQEVGRRLEEAAHGEVGKELGKVQELIKANIQRSKVIQDQVRSSDTLLGFHLLIRLPLVFTILICLILFPSLLTFLLFHSFFSSLLFSY